MKRDGPIRPATVPTAGRSVGRLSLLLAPLIGLVPAAAAAQDDGWLETVRDFHPYAAITYTDDSNLLRRSDGSPLGTKSDTYTILEAGFATELKLSRQRFLLDGGIFRTWYDRFDQFDHTGGDARALWKWVYGDLWEGDLGYAYSRNIRSFANQDVPRKDMLDRHRLFGNANRWLTDRWRAGVRADWTDISASESEGLDKNRTGYGAALDYVTANRNSLGLDVGYSTVDFDQAGERDYDDLRILATARWQPSTKLLLLGNLGYAERDHEELSERDFSGMVGEASANWEITTKTSLKAAVWRDISNLDDEVADYAIINGVSIEPLWRITPKTALHGVAAYEERDFQDGTTIDPSFADRKDEVTSLELWLDWQARRNILLSVGFISEDRSSNRELEEYDYQSVQARLSVGL